MAAGLGFKDFTTGEVLTAADVDGYLMQGVWVFASAAARDAAVTSPQEGNFAYLKDTNVTTYYTGSAWANLDTTGMTNPMTTTGDTIYSSSGSTPARLGIGTTGQILTVAGGVPSWATPSASASGMTLITSQDFTTSSNISVNDVFSATYLTYMVIISCTPTNFFDADLRFRVSGSDNSTNNYFNRGLICDAGGLGASTAERGASYFRIAGAEINSGSSLCQMWISAPYATRETLLFTQNVNKDRWKSQNGLFNDTTSFTGFSFFPNANTMTGNVKVYGLANS